MAVSITSQSKITSLFCKYCFDVFLNVETLSIRYVFRAIQVVCFAAATRECIIKAYRFYFRGQSARRMYAASSEYCGVFD